MRQHACVPPSSRRRTRFGNYPKAVAIRNIARTFRSPAVDQAERDDFRALLSVLHPRQGPRAPDGTPVQLVQDEESETRRDADGRELSPLEAARLDTYNAALREFKRLDPNYAALTPSDWIPDDAAVARIEEELRATESRAAASAAGDAAPSITGDALFPNLPEPHPSTDNPFSHVEKSPAQPLPAGSPQPAAKPVPPSTDRPDVTTAPKPFPAPPPSETDPSPPVRINHIFDGEINKAGKAVGFHRRPGGKDPATARMTMLDKEPNSLNVYVGRVEVKDPVTGRFIAKKAPSTFFPDNLTTEQVKGAIDTAYHDSGLKGDGKFIGESGLGFKTEGFYTKRGGIMTA